jgi:hypothetical protein
MFAILSGVSMIFLPDTPRWYYARDNIPEGDKTLSRIYGVYRKGVTNHGDVPEIQAMKQNIMETFHVEEESSNRLTLLSLVWDNTPLRVGRRVRISFLILAIQQSMGINMLVYYMTLIFTNVGLSAFLASLLAAISLTVQWVGSLLCVVTIERIGRRRIMMWTACIETCCMLIFVVLNTLKHKTVSTQWAAAMIMFPYMFFYGWGWVGCPWLYGPEVYSWQSNMQIPLYTLANANNELSDCAPSLPSYRICSWTSWRVALHLPHRLCRRYCFGDRGCEDLDLAAYFQRHRFPVCVLYVS